MTCPSCSQPVPDGARFCPNCGAALPVSEQPSEPVASDEAPPPPILTPPPEPAFGGEEAGDAPPETSLPAHEGPLEPEAPAAEDLEPPPSPADEPEPMPRAVTGEPIPGAGAGRATVLGALVFVVMLLLSAVIAFAAFFSSDADLVDVAKLSGVIFFAFHHVGVHTQIPTFDPSSVGAGQGPFPVGPVDVSFTISVALLLGTLLALILLFRAGRRAAEEGGGSTGARMLQGAVVGLPYAALSALLSLVIRFEFALSPQLAPFFGPTGSVDVTVPLLPALLWPLGIGVVAGALGGYAAAHRDRATRGRLSAAMSGGWRMLLALLIAGFVGLLILGAVNPDLTASYFEAVTSGRSGLVLLLATIAAVPNMALWGISMGMGGSIVAGDFLGTDVRHVASLLEFPRDLGPLLGGGSFLGGEGLAEVSTEVAPVEYFAFIALTLIALVVGGRLAAQRAGVLSRGEGALVGASSGVAFALAFLGLLALSGLTSGFALATTGESQDQLIRFGPNLMMVGVLGLAWGVVAGALGGATGMGAAAPFPVERRPAPPPAAPEDVPQEAAPPPAAGATGFEGLAAQRAALRPPRPQPEPEPEPEPEPQPEPEAGPAPERPVAEAAEDETVGEAPSAAPQQPPAFEFTTPEAQWRAPEAPRPEAAPSETEEGEPEPWPPPGTGSSEATETEPASEESPRDEASGGPGEEAAPWSDPAAFEPRPWEEPSEPQDADEEEEEEGEGPAPA